MFYEILHGLVDCPGNPLKLARPNQFSTVGGANVKESSDRIRIAIKRV